MAKTVKPFKATHYRQSLLDNFSKVACPPYDVIDNKKASILKKRSQYNYCRISLAEGKNYDQPAQNLKKWIEKGVLVQGQTESHYLYKQKFKIAKKEFSRYGVLCLLNMKKKEIFPHEHTLAKPREDRKKMIAKVKANLSPIFVIAGNADDFLNLLSKKYNKRKPLIKFKDDQGDFNWLWKIDEKNDISKISSSLDKSYLVIADGHHRFETSFDYFKKNKNKFKDLEYILAYVTIPQQGLVILPTHRIISAPAKNKENFAKLKKECKLKQVSKAELAKKLKSNKKFCFGLYWQKKFYFATLQNKDILDTISPAVYKKLDTYIFHHSILSQLDYKDMNYTHSIDEAKKITKKNQMAFLLKPASLTAVFDIAKAGYKLPQKATYFYPKISSGLVLRRFEK